MKRKGFSITKGFFNFHTEYRNEQISKERRAVRAYNKA